jgi:peptidoglycan/LPS O-acetylase OafA/YrhL
MYISVMIKNHFVTHPILGMNIAFILSIIFLYPLSWASYWTLEALYFKGKSRPQKHLKEI